MGSSPRSRDRKDPPAETQTLQARQSPDARRQSASLRQEKPAAASQRVVPEPFGHFPRQTGFDSVARVFMLPAVHRQSLSAIVVTTSRSAPASRNSAPECARLKLGIRCTIITDTNVGREYAKPAYNSLPAPALNRPSSSCLLETAKSLKTVQRC